jgi:hypothetical protein
MGFLTILTRALYLFPLSTMPRSLSITPSDYPSIPVVLVATHPNQPFPSEWLHKNHRTIYLNPEKALVKTIEGLEVQDVSPSLSLFASNTEKMDDETEQRYEEWTEWRSHLETTSPLYSRMEYISLQHNMARKIDRIIAESQQQHSDATIFISYLWMHPHSVWSDLRRQDQILVASPYLDDKHTPYGDVLYMTDSQLLKNKI